MTKRLYTHINLYDGLHDRIDKDVDMLVDDSGKIIDIQSKINKSKADKVINLHNKYVMPGLINVHTHISLDPHTATGDGNADIVTSTVRAIKHLHELLRSGVTYIRGCGSNHETLDITLSKLQRDGKLAKSPRIMPTGQPMTITGGHGTLFGGGDVVDSPDEMRKAVRQNFANGAQCTKVMATGGVMSQADNMTQPQLKIPEMRVAVEETHSKHSIVAAHAEANPGIYNAIKAGVDSIEHGCYVNDKEIKMMLKRGTYLTPTLMAPWCILAFGKKSLPKWELKKTEDVVDDMYHNIHNAYQQGVKMTLGTDAGCPYNYFDQTPKELELMVTKTGFSNYDALSTIRNSASLMKLKDYGTLEKGKYADFLALDHNPLENVKAVQQKDKAVYQHGRREY